jgi:hypothetical protein
MATIELERTLVKSPPELWEELGPPDGLRRWLGDVRVVAAEPPHRLEWDNDVAAGVIELEASGWGTTVRAVAKPGAPGVEERLTELLDELGSSSLSGG